LSLHDALPILRLASVIYPRQRRQGRIAFDRTSVFLTFDLRARANTTRLECDGQRASALRFDDRRVQALFSALVMFSPHLNGFCHRQLREHLAQLLGLDPATYPPGRMTYDLRRLRLHGLIPPLPPPHPYPPPPQGLRVALFFTRPHAPLLPPKLADIFDPAPRAATPLRKAFDRVDQEIKRCCLELNLAA